MAHEDGQWRFARKRHAPGQHLVTEHAERVHVGATVHRLSVHLLGGEVRRGPDRELGPGVPHGVADQAGDPEDGEELRAAQVFADDECRGRERILGTTGDDKLFAPAAGGCLFGLRANDQLTGAQGDEGRPGGGVE